MKQTRRRFSRGIQARGGAADGPAGTRLADVTRALGVDAQVVRRWQEQVARGPETAFPDNGWAPAEKAELQRLRREVS